MIPDLLQTRLDLLQEQDTAYDLLDALHNTGQGAEAEEKFLTEQIAVIESELERSESDVEALIDKLRDDLVAWTIARLRYMQAYTWEEASSRVGVTMEAGKARTLRGFRKIYGQ